MNSPRVAVAPHPFARGFDGTGRTVEDVYEILELAEALTRIYDTDAHLVTYVVSGATRQPRINKPGLAAFDRPVEVGVFFADVDNPDHCPWTPALRATADEQHRSLPILQTCGIYLTQHGRRLVQPLAAPIPVERVEPYLHRWLLQLTDAGIDIDRNCRDWTRHFRLPHVRRGGRAYRSPLVDLDRMQPIALAPIAEPAPVAATGSRAVGPRPPVTVNWRVDVPAPWRARVELIAAAVREVQSEWHTLFLALAGALLACGAPPELVPALCRAISLATGADARTRDRVAAARTTVERRLAGQSTTGYGDLARRWPDVADAVDAAFARGVEAHVRALAAAPAVTPARTLAESTTALRDAIRRAPDGVTLISAECGLGKTHAAIAVAADRATKPYVSPSATGQRAPLQSKTSISVDKNDLAIQVTRDLRARGAPVQRIFGALSLLDEHGEPCCRYAAVAAPLVAGGQSMQRELCEGRGIERCEHYDQCSARKGREGPAGARITVGTHALIAELDSAAGSTGLLVIDEPPALLETVALRVDDIDTARAMLGWFEGRYASALAPALAAIRAWVAERGELDRPCLLAEAVRECGAAAIDPDDLDRAHRITGTSGDVVACAQAALRPDHHGTAPPIQFMYLKLARRSVARARELGDASKVLGAIHRALTSETRVAARIEQRGEERLLLLTAARDDFARALRREGSVVVTDANADLHADIIAKVVGYAPPHHRFAAADGAPVARTLLRCRSATRKHWLTGRCFVLDPSLLTAVRALFDWAREDPSARRLGLITMRTIELALAAALRPSDTDIAHAWAEAGQPVSLLTDARAAFGPIVRGWPGEVLLGHYGAVRGLNTMADVDCLATLGDPWPNLGAVRNDVAFLGLDVAWEARLELMCRAELEQAHGRLRAVHRSRPGRALHVGNVLPSGVGWSSGQVQIRKLPVGRPKTVAAMTPAALLEAVGVLGGLRAAARTLGCNLSTLHRYVQGERAIPTALAERVEGLVLKSDQNPAA